MSICLFELIIVVYAECKKDDDCCAVRTQGRVAGPSVYDLRQLKFCKYIFGFMVKHPFRTIALRIIKKLYAQDINRDVQFEKFDVCYPTVSFDPFTSEFEETYLSHQNKI